MMLPGVFLERPIAHRALHDLSQGRPENSVGAVLAAIEHGFGIEVDIQLTADGQALVFHDYDLFRLTGSRGAVRDRTARDLATIPLTGSSEAPPTLPQVLAIVAGRVPLLIEIKDQDGALGDDVGPLEAAVAGALDGYDGPVAVMSFNPHSISAMQVLAPDVPRGLVTDPFTAEDWPVPAERRARLAAIEDFERVGACFISHNRRDLASPRVAELRAGGTPVLCWTIRSPEEEAAARQYADNVTFEGYIPGAGA